MKTALFDYELPADLIAQRPPDERDGGRLLVVEPTGVSHDRVRHFAQWLAQDDLLVLNDTRVRKARLICHRPSNGSFGGGQVELLFLRQHDERIWVALGKANRPLRVGDRLLSGTLELSVLEKLPQGTLAIEVSGDLEACLLERGSMPIPPYLARDSDVDDESRYQTVFSRHLGSAAAPTAGLHLTEELLRQIAARNIRIAQVTLHVGLGTFRPVTAADLDEHPMHSEQLVVPEATAQAIAETRRRGGRVVAVGTTVVRALESTRDPSRVGHVVPSTCSTDLLIQPGYRFCVVDALLTNFHQPKSTLLALVSAFAGYDRTFSAYRIAVAERYRFLSYGDAMWIPQYYERPA